MGQRFIKVDCGTEHAIYNVNCIKRVYYNSEMDDLTIDFFDGVTAVTDTYYPKSKKKMLAEIYAMLNSGDNNAEETEEETGKNIEDE